MHCAACDAGVEYGQDLCHVCKDVVMEYNRDIIDQENDEIYIDKNGEVIVP